MNHSLRDIPVQLNLLGFSLSDGDGGTRTRGMFPPSWARGIPVGSRGVVEAFALVDLETYEWASAIKWRLHNRGGWRYVRGNHGEFLHRQVMGLKTGDPRTVDHINRDPLDNRRANLRIVTVAQNAQNQPSRGLSSSYRGVCWDKRKGRWLAQHTLDGQNHHIGRFDSEEQAAEAAARWRATHMPFSEEAA